MCTHSENCSTPLLASLVLPYWRTLHQLSLKFTDLKCAEGVAIVRRVCAASRADQARYKLMSYRAAPVQVYIM